MVIIEPLRPNSSDSSPYRKELLLKRLQQLTDHNGYQFVQTNGQRVYAPTDSMNIPPPPKGCEVFIGKLYKNIYEDELIPLFEKIGRLYKFRLMLDFSEKTRGYAFATYFNTDDANRAVLKLNKYEIRPNLNIGVYKSVDNCRLFFGNLPTDKKRSELVNVLLKYVHGIKEVILYQDYENPRLNRGFAFVEFENHRLAAMARRQFTPENLIAWGQPIFVDWADPLPDVNPKVMAKVTIIFVTNLPVCYTTEEFHTLICNLVGRDKVTKTYKMFNYAFVHFVDRQCAEIGFNKVLGLKIDGIPVRVEWARPRRFSKKHRLTIQPDNFCTSVPPNMRRKINEQKKQYINENNQLVTSSSNLQNYSDFSYFTN